MAKALAVYIPALCEPYALLAVKILSLSNESVCLPAVTMITYVLKKY